MLRVRHLTKHYGERLVLDGLDFEVEPGEVVVLAGANGSGKTTTIECITGLRRADAGEVNIAGRPFTGTRAQRALFGLQLQESGLPPNTRVAEALTLLAKLYASPVPVDQLLERMGLDRHAGTAYGRLSGGEKRRLNVAIALLGSPPLLVLDEPTSGVDAQGRAELWGLIREMARTGTSVLLTTHDLTEAEDYADRLLALDGGRIALAGTVAALLAAHRATWRLRAFGAHAGMTSMLEDAGLQVLTRDGVLTAFGPRERVLDARALAEERADGGARDLVAGPTRLEDVFLLEAAGRG